ncbi:polysaccharide deacetylase family protein [Longispora sp. K20-0274]|uniref:polysaccharide deacetylase family protein n=1 Tax=Longispora sp. K20-0274 TaxID=3088255 RepID=UPI0039995213
MLTPHPRSPALRLATLVALLTLTATGTAGCSKAVGHPAAQTSAAATSEAVSTTPPAAPTTPPPSPTPSPTRSRAASPSASPSAKYKDTRPPNSQPGIAGALRGTGSSAIALTFDDGPDPNVTPALLDLLAQQGVKATFCLVGHRARDNPAIVARIAAEGHTLCNHSWQHLDNLSDRDDNYLRWDLKSTNDAILAAAPGAKLNYFRAPYGKFTPRLVAFAAELDLTPIFWDVDDQCFKTAEFGTGQAMIGHMTQEVQRDTRPGSILLSHDNLKPHTVTAYRTLLPWLKARYTLIALPTH